MDFRTQESVAARRSESPNLFTLADIFLWSAEHVAVLTLASARSAIEDSLSGANGLLNSSDLQEVAAVQASVVGSTLDTAFNYSRFLYEITARTQEELARAFESGHDRR